VRVGFAAIRGVPQHLPARKLSAEAEALKNSPMRVVPIFDTNIFGDVHRGRISPQDWKFLLRHRPGRGCPLSSVTAFELLAGVDACRPEDFPDVRDRVSTAFKLSNGRILDEPRRLICKEILRISAPEDMPAFSTVVSRYMDVIRRAKSHRDLVDGRVRYKGLRARVIDTSVLTLVMSGPKETWIGIVEQSATEKYPAWRELFEKSGRRLPIEMRNDLEPRSAWADFAPGIVDGLIRRLGGSPTPDLISELCTRLDAVCEFSLFIAREFLLRNYSVTKHQSDIFDQFQLHHLALDRFVIVTHDPDLTKRTRLSSQVDRIMTFDEFLRTL